MIFWKAVGCVCVAAGAALGCASYATFLSKRLRAIERAARFASFVSEQIEYYETPYPEIVRRFAAAEGIADVTPESHITPQTLAGIGRALADGMDMGDAARFLSFYDGVGAGFADAEMRVCEGEKRYFEERHAALRGEFAKKKRARCALALFAAFSVCVLVW